MAANENPGTLYDDIQIGSHVCVADQTAVVIFRNLDRESSWVHHCALCNSTFIVRSFGRSHNKRYRKSNPFIIIL